MKPKILAWDLENTPNLGYIWGLFNQNISLNQIADVGNVICFAARWVGDPKSKIMFYSDFHDGHEVMVKAAWDLIDEADALLSWNGKAFDTKKMNREFVLSGYAPPSPVKEIDMLLASRRKFKFVSNKLDQVAQELGVGSKVKHAGFELWLKCMAGDPTAWATMEKYNKQDVHLLIEIYDRLLPWLDGHPNANLYGIPGCPRGCGTRYLQKRGFTRTTVGVYQRYQCTKCGAWSKSGKSIETVDLREDK